MPFLDYGTSEGLAYRHNFQQDIANRHANEQLDRQANIDAQSNAQLMGSLFKKSNLIDDSYYGGKLKDFSEGIIKDMGTYMSQHSLWKTNPMEYAHVSDMHDSLVDNKWTKGIMSFKGNVDLLNKHLNKHPEDSLHPDIDGVNGVGGYKQKADNWLKTGDINGNKGMDTPYQFTVPKPLINMNEWGEKIAKNIPQDQVNNANGTISYTTPELKVQNGIESGLKDLSSLYSLQIERRGQSDLDKRLTDVEYAHKYHVSPYLKSDSTTPDKFGLFKREQDYKQAQKKTNDNLEEGNVNILPDKYNEAKVSPTNSTDIDPEIVYKTQSSKTPFDGSNVLFTDANGKIGKYNLGIIKGVPTSKLHDISGVPAFGYTIIMPLDDLKNSKIPYDSDDQQFIHSTKHISGNDVDMVTFPIMKPVNVKDKGVQSNANSTVHVPQKKSAAFNKSNTFDTVTDPNTGDVWQKNADNSYTLVKHGKQ